MTTMGKKLLGGAVGVIAVAGQVVRHAAWYVRYRVDGTSRDEPPRPPGRRRRA
jgi:hypothetical protein